MGIDDTYPNGYKDGYSSSDHATQSYSPYAVERDRRNAAYDSAMRDYRMERYEVGLEKERERKRKILEEREREERKLEQERKRSEEHIKMSTDSIRYLCEQKRKAYKNRSLFSRAIATLSGKGYYKIDFWKNAENEVFKMNDEQLEDFYNKHVR